MKDYKINEDGIIISKLKGDPMKTQITNSGYELVHLTENGIRKAFTVHRLVAKEFIPNPDNKPHVNHKDGNKLNNKKDNLEWTTPSENMLHAFKDDKNQNARNKARERMRIIGKKYGGKSEGFKNRCILVRKQVIQMDLSGNVINEFPSTRAARTISPNVSKVLSGKFYQSGGFKLAYK